MQHKRLLSLGVALTLTTQLAACGTVFYPERRGQISGQIDPGVAILNGMGLLFYVVPGLIAFAVDFTTGAIYLPDERYTLTPEQMRQIVDEQGQLDPTRLQGLLQRDFSHRVELHGAVLLTSPQAEQLAVLGLPARG